MKKIGFFILMILSLQTFAQDDSAVPPQANPLSAEQILQKKVDSLTKKLKKAGKMLKSPVRLSIGGNFSDLEKVKFRSYYARFSFYKDGFNPFRKFCTDSVTMKCANNKDKKRATLLQSIDLGFYAGLFKQSYLNKYTQPNTVFSKSLITQIDNDSLQAERRYYRIDSNLTTLDQVGFFVAPNILLAKQQFSKKKFLTIRANLDVEYLKNFENTTNVTTPLDTVRFKQPVAQLDSVNAAFQDQKTYDENTSINTFAQRFIGGGFSLYYKQKNLDFLFKLASGNVTYFNGKDDPKSKYYVINYFCVSHSPTGIRLGGEIRKSHDVATNSSKFNYNLFIAYCFDFQKFAALYPAAK